MKKKTQSNRAKNYTASLSDPVLLNSLSPKVRTTVLSSFPSHENNIFFMSMGQTKVQDQTYLNCLCAMSFHYISLFSEESKEKYVHIVLFNILDLCKFEFISEDKTNQQIVLKTFSGLNVSFSTGPLFQIARIIFRNYTLSTASLPKDLRVTFRVSDDSLFPSIQLPLSISQIFQFRYAALCAQSGQKYDHSIVQYFHSLMKTHNPIFNLKHLPNSFYEQQMGPMFRSLMFIPTIYGISCKDSDLPSLFTDIAPLTSKSCYLKYLKLINCNISSGIEELAKAISDNNQALPLEQLFINDNEVEDLELLIRALSGLESNMTHLSLTNCGIKETDLELLGNLLLTSKTFQTLKFLGIGGAEFSEDSFKDISKFLCKKGKIETLDLSGSSNFSFILKMIPKTTVTNLILADCDFDDEAVEQINLIAPYLASLDISGSNLNYFEVSDLLPCFGIKQKSLLTIKLNRLNFAKERSFPILRGFLLNDFSKWKSIELDETQITATELYAYQALFTKMPNLENLSLNSNFDINSSKVVGSLADIPSLKSLSLSNSQLAVIIPQIIASKSLKSINLSANELTDQDALDLLNSPNLECVKLDENQFSEFDKIVELANNNPRLRSAPLKHGLSSILCQKFTEFSEMMSNILGKFNTYQHSCICEDLQMPYPFPREHRDQQMLNLGDSTIYDIPRLNIVAVEDGFTPQKIKKVTIYPAVEVTSQDDNPLSSASGLSIDELMNTNLIPTISDTMFAGLGGALSDESSMIVEKRKTNPVYTRKDEDNDILALMESPSLAPTDYKIPFDRSANFESSNSEDQFSTLDNTKDINNKPPRDAPPPFYDSEVSNSNNKELIVDNNVEIESDSEWVNVTSNTPVKSLATTITTSGTPKRLFVNSDSESPIKNAQMSPELSSKGNDENRNVNLKSPHIQTTKENNNSSSDDSAPNYKDKNIDDYLSEEENHNNEEEMEYEDESNTDYTNKNIYNNKNNNNNIKQRNVNNDDFYNEEKVEQKNLSQKSTPHKNVVIKATNSAQQQKKSSIKEYDEGNSNENSDNDDFAGFNRRDIANRRSAPASYSPAESPSLHKSRIPAPSKTYRCSPKQNKSESDDNNEENNDNDLDDEAMRSPGHKSRIPTPSSLKNSPLALRRSTDDLNNGSSNKSPSYSNHKSKIPGRQSPVMTAKSPTSRSPSKIPQFNQQPPQQPLQKTAFKDNEDEEIENDNEEIEDENEDLIEPNESQQEKVFDDNYHQNEYDEEYENDDPQIGIVDNAENEEEEEEAEDINEPKEQKIPLKKSSSPFENKSGHAKKSFFDSDSNSNDSNSDYQANIEEVNHKMQPSQFSDEESENSGREEQEMKTQKQNKPQQQSPKRLPTKIINSDAYSSSSVGEKEQINNHPQYNHFDDYEIDEEQEILEDNNNNNKTNNKRPQNAFDSDQESDDKDEGNEYLKANRNQVQNSTKKTKSSHIKEKKKRNFFDSERDKNNINISNDGNEFEEEEDDDEDKEDELNPNEGKDGRNQDSRKSSLSLASSSVVSSRKASIEQAQQKQQKTQKGKNLFDISESEKDDDDYNHEIEENQQQPNEEDDNLLFFSSDNNKKGKNNNANKAKNWLDTDTTDSNALNTVSNADENENNFTNIQKQKQIPSIPKIPADYTSSSTTNQSREAYSAIQNSSDTIPDRHPSLSEEEEEMVKKMRARKLIEMNKLQEKKNKNMTLNDNDDDSSLFNSVSSFFSSSEEPVKKQLKIQQQQKNKKNASSSNDKVKRKGNNSLKKSKNTFSSSSYLENENENENENEIGSENVSNAVPSDYRKGNDDGRVQKNSPSKVVSLKDTSNNNRKGKIKSDSSSFSSSPLSREETLDAAQDFLALTSGLFSMQKRKKLKNQINPLILAFSPPVLSIE